jgi:hypothetical protein
MIVVDGTVITGLAGQGASLTVPQQWPTVVRFIPAIQNCEQRTINVQLKHPLLIQNPDLTLSVPWGGGLEAISFVEIEFECPTGQPPRQAWIYIPHNSPHRSNSFFAEIVTSKVDNLKPFAECRLYLRRASYLV